MYIPFRKPPVKISAVIRGHGWNVLSTVYLHKTKPVLFWFKYPGLHSRIDTSILRTYLTSHYSSVKVKHILLDTLDVPFDLRSHKWVHMKVDEKSISFTKGFERENKISFDPDSVLVTGPSSFVKKIADTLQIRVPYKELNKNFDESFRLSYFLHNSYLLLSHEKVNVQFKVRKKETSYAGK